jgi:hypothetical protein
MLAQLAPHSVLTACFAVVSMCCWAGALCCWVIAMRSRRPAAPWYLLDSPALRHMPERGRRFVRWYFFFWVTAAASAIAAFVLSPM